MKSYEYFCIGSQNLHSHRQTETEILKTLLKGSERYKNRWFGYEYLRLNPRTVHTVITRAAGYYSFTFKIKTILNPTTQSIASR
jgi:hypothetical protein